MYILKQINVWTATKISTILSFILSLVMIFPMFLFSLLISSLNFTQDQPEMGGLFMGGFMLILPFFYAIFGGISTAIMTFLYNIIATKMGGLQFNISKLATSEEVEN